MFNILKMLFSNQDDKDNNVYIAVQEDEMDSELRNRIFKLENLAKGLTQELQRKYAPQFKDSGKPNLKVWVHRDIDGDEIELLTLERFFTKEYRAVVAINFDREDSDGDFVTYIQLWYYFGGYRKGEGTLYNSATRNLKADIEEVLNEILTNKNSI
jgi:hypothetical protein